MSDDPRKTDVSEYRYDEDAEGHENQLEFNRDYTIYDRLKDTGLINEAREEAVPQELEKGPPKKTRGGGGGCGTVPPTPLRRGAKTMDVAFQ